jgi:hypothetical protein
MIWHDHEVMHLKLARRYICSQHTMRSIAFRSDCNNRRAKLVFVVTKNTRELLITFSGRAFRAGCAIAGAEARFFSL